MPAMLQRIILYTPRMAEMAAFYTGYFGYEVIAPEPGDRIVELRHPAGGLVLMLHPAAKGQKAGQVLVKLVFDVPDVVAAVAGFAARGLVFGAIHQGGGYQFANGKDPSGNPISISSRAFAASAG